LAAQKSLSTKILKIANTCQVTAILYDLKKSTAEQAATAEGRCTEGYLLKAVREIAQKLCAKATTGQAASSKSSDFDNYLINKNLEMARNEKIEKAWKIIVRIFKSKRETNKSRKRAVTSFLAEFKERNPHKSEAEKLLAEIPGRLTVKTVPSKAQVSVNGVSAGISPISMDEKADAYKVTATSDGYYKAEQTTMVEPGEEAVISMVLKKIPPGVLEIVTEPKGALVTINGDKVGKSSVTRELKPGSYLVEASLDGYEKRKKTAKVEAGERTKLILPLQELPPGTVTIETKPEGAIVWISGERAGISPVKKSLRSGSYMIKASIKGYFDGTRMINLESGKQVGITISLSARPGKLVVRTKPSGALVLVDGEKIGISPVEKDVSVGSHLVKATLDGFIGAKQAVKVGSMEKSEVVLSLAETGVLIVRTKPEAAMIYIDDKQFGVSPVTARNLSGGKHRVSVRKKGYGETVQVAEVMAGKKTEALVSLNALPGTLVVNTTPSGADIIIDGRKIGRSPLEKKVAAGKYLVKASLDGYFAGESEATIEPGKKTGLSLDLKTPGYLVVDTDPEGAEIWIDGKKFGKSPVRIKSRAGRYKIKAFMEGYVVTSRDSVVKYGEDTNIKIPLEGLPGTLVVTTRPAGATIFIDKKLAGKPPLTKDLPSRKYLVSAYLSGYLSGKRSVEIQRGKMSKIELVLKKIGPGTLVVNTRPAGAKVFINGKKEGISPVTRQLTPGNYEVKAVLEGFDQAGQKVHVAGEKQTKVDLSLVMVYPMNPYKKWGHITFWSGVAMAGFGGLSASMAKSAAEDHKASGDQAAADRSRTWAGLMYAGLGLGFAGLVTGIVLWTLSPGDREWFEKNTAALTVESTGSGVTFSLVWRW